MVDVPFMESMDRLKESFLFAAAQGGNTEDCESLLEIGANIEWRNPEGDTPLLVRNYRGMDVFCRIMILLYFVLPQAAARRGHCDTIQSLLVHGANVNAIGKDSLSALHVCCLRGDCKALNVLLQSRPSLTLRTKDGKTALEIAETKGFEDVCARLTTLLVSSGTDSTLWHASSSKMSTSSDRDAEGRSQRDRRKQAAATTASGSATLGVS